VLLPGLDLLNRGSFAFFKSLALDTDAVQILEDSL
jgi:hypothetical protein